MVVCLLFVQVVQHQHGQCSFVEATQSMQAIENIQ